MDFSAFDASAIGTTFAVGMTMAAAFRAAFRSTKVNAQQVVVPQVAPQVAAPIVQAQAPPQAVVQGPVAPVVPPVPLVVVPPVVALAVTWNLALQARDMIVMAMAQAAFDTSHLVPNVGRPKRRVRGLRHDFRNMNDTRILDILRATWDGCRTKGSSCLATPNFNLGTQEVDIFERLPKCFQHVAITDARWVNRPDHRASVMHFGPRAYEHVVARTNGNAVKVDDSYYEFKDVRSDTLWLFTYFMGWVVLAYRYGATYQQAKYIGACCAFEALFVSKGFNPGEEIMGASPEDFGFDVPNDLPMAYVRR